MTHTSRRPVPSTESRTGIRSFRRSRRRESPALTTSLRHLSEFSCRTADGVELVGIHVPREGRDTRRAEPGTRSEPPSANAAERLFVLAHGFTHGIGKPATTATVAAFAGHGDVAAVDFRGHGRSGGRSSVGRDETLDLDAVVGWAREQGYGTVTVVGFSMGGAVALRHAAIGDHRPDAVVSVSAPARWYVRESAAMRRVHWLLESPLGPRVGRLLGLRLGAPWDELPSSPIETVGAITVPVLLVHGTADRYFGPAHAVALHRAAGSGSEVWIEQGMGHGETGMTAATTHRIARWSEAAARPRAGADGASAPESTRAGSVQRERAGADAADAGRQAS